MSVARTRFVGVVFAGLSLFPLLSACSGDDDTRAVAGTAPVTTPPVVTDPPATTAASTTTAAPTTTQAPTTTAAPTTTLEATTTTAAPTTTVAALPVPVPSPADTRGQEPVIDLGTIEIPKINISKKMFEGVRLTTLDRGPGHWPGTAMPGQTGNVVVAGHRTSHDKPFRHVDQLVAGDEVIFNTVDGRFVYHVTSIEIVKPDAIWIIDQTAEKTATLFACHPVGSTRERIVVHLALSA